MWTWNTTRPRRSTTRWARQGNRRGGVWQGGEDCTWGLREAAGIAAGGEREETWALSPSARRHTGDGSGAREQMEIEGAEEDSEPKAGRTLLGAMAPTTGGWSDLVEERRPEEQCGIGTDLSRSRAGRAQNKTVAA